MENINFSELGLTEIEGRIFVSLLKLGISKAGPIIRKTELHRATVYDGLQRLMEKGLVTFIIKEKTKYFQASKPDQLLELLKEKKKSLELQSRYAQRIVGELNRIKRQEKSRETATVYQGINGLRAVFEEILLCNNICSFASKGKFEEILKDYFYQFQNKKKSKGIKDRILINEELKNTAYTDSIYGDIRFLPKNFEYPTATEIYGSKVAIFVFSESPIAFVIESKETSDSFRSYFELLWKLAKK